ncbi:MAG TPA: secretin N-terminal domain-containing protein, partial [Verrucomicrobiae bacterium]
NQPNVSIRFENVSAAEALNAVLENYNLALVQDPKSKIARVTIKDPKAEDPLVSRVIQLRYSDPTNIVGLVKASLSQRSSVVADTRTSQLIVNTTEKELDGITTLINRLDTATKQVLIEARLYETARNPSTIKGVDWTGTLQGQNIKFGNNVPDAIPFKPGSPPIPPTPGSPPGTLGTPGVPAQQAVLSREFGNGPKLAFNTMSGFFPAAGFLNADGANLVLSFLNSDAESEVLSMPRAVTLDNRTAILSVTRAFPVYQITPGSANSPAGATITYTNLGTILAVTPRIAADKNISMRIIPEVSNIDSVDHQTINGLDNTANIYAIRRIETHVMIPSGNTLVMGGMISDSKTKGFTKVPLFGDLPGVGNLFRKESKNRNKSNLLIFITPTIVEDDSYQISSSGTDFLKTRFVERPEPKDSDWDSAKPHDWSKPVF